MLLRAVEERWKERKWGKDGGWIIIHTDVMGGPHRGLRPHSSLRQLRLIVTKCSGLGGGCGWSRG